MGRIAWTTDYGGGIREQTGVYQTPAGSICAKGEDSQGVACRLRSRLDKMVTGLSARQKLT